MLTRTRKLITHLAQFEAEATNTATATATSIARAEAQGPAHKTANMAEILK